MSVKQVATLVGKELIYGGHLQCLGAAGVAFVASVLLQIDLTWDCFVVVYLLLYPAYLYNRYKEIDEDELTNPARTHHFRKYVDQMPMLLWLVVPLVIGLVLAFSNWAALVFSLCLIVFGLLYTIAFKPITKYILLFKNIYVSAFFAALVFFPIVYFNVVITPAQEQLAVLLALFVLLKALMMQIFLDIKDIESDQRQNLRTIPILLGKENALPYLLIADLGLSIAFPLLISLIYGQSPASFWIFVLTIPLLIYCYQLVKAENYYGYVLRSAEFLSWLVMMALLKNL